MGGGCGRDLDLCVCSIHTYFDLDEDAQPERLDLTDVYCKRAKELKLKVVISANAHWTSDIDFLRYGIDQARRGWLEADDVLNTKSWDEIADVFER